MRLALAESEQLGHGYVGDEHVLLGLLREQASRASSLCGHTAWILPAPALSCSGCPRPG